MHMKKSLIFLLCLLALLPAGCGRNTGNEAPSDGGSANSVGNASGGREPDNTGTPDDGEPGAGQTKTTPESAYPLYYFGSFLEESEPVEDDSFFANALFLGDSRTEGLQLWGGIAQGDYLWKRGITVLEVDSDKYTFDIGGQQLTMVRAMAHRQYDKVYLMMGINELGCAVEKYEEGLSAFLDQIIAAQPQAVIYIQTLPPLNDKLAEEHLNDYERNAQVNAFNELIIRLAREKRIALLNTAEVYRGEDGQLPADMTGDGCHFNSDQYTPWADYLRRHTIDPARYFYCRELENPPVIDPGAVEGAGEGGGQP